MKPFGYNLFDFGLCVALMLLGAASFVLPPLAQHIAIHAVGVFAVFLLGRVTAYRRAANYMREVNKFWNAEDLARFVRQEKEPQQ